MPHRRRRRFEWTAIFILALALAGVGAIAYQNFMFARANAAKIDDLKKSLCTISKIYLTPDSIEENCKKL
jgi:hypothetical protein